MPSRSAASKRTGLTMLAGCTGIWQRAPHSGHVSVCPAKLPGTLKTSPQFGHRTSSMLLPLLWAQPTLPPDRPTGSVPTGPYQSSLPTPPCQHKRPGSLEPGRLAAASTAMVFAATGCYSLDGRAASSVSPRATAPVPCVPTLVWPLGPTGGPFTISPSRSVPADERGLTPSLNFAKIRAHCPPRSRPCRFQRFPPPFPSRPPHARQSAPRSAELRRRPPSSPSVPLRFAFPPRSAAQSVLSLPDGFGL